MSSIVRRCRECGHEHELGFPGVCVGCLSPDLGYWCRRHSPKGAEFLSTSDCGVCRAEEVREKEVLAERVRRAAELREEALRREEAARAERERAEVAEVEAALKREALEAAVRAREERRLRIRRTVNRILWPLAFVVDVYRAERLRIKMVALAALGLTGFGFVFVPAFRRPIAEYTMWAIPKPLAVHQIGAGLSLDLGPSPAIREAEAAFSDGMDGVGVRLAFKGALLVDDARHGEFLAGFLEESGDTAGARKAWEKAVSLAPKAPTARRNLGAFYLAQAARRGAYGDAASAQKLLQLARVQLYEAVTLGADDPLTLGYFGCLELLEDPTRRGSPYLEKAGAGPWQACVPAEES